MSKKDKLLVAFAIICGLIMFAFLVKHIKTEQENREREELLADTLSLEAQYWHCRLFPTLRRHSPSNSHARNLPRYNQSTGTIR